MVSAITSPDRTGAKVYYQSGLDCTGLVPVWAMEASQPFGGQCPRLPLKNETGTNPYYLVVVYNNLLVTLVTLVTQKIVVDRPL